MTPIQLELGYTIGPSGTASQSEQSRSSTRKAITKAGHRASADPADARLAAALISNLTDLASNGSAHILVSCSKEKNNAAMPASELYSSQLFLKSANLAKRLNIPFSVLSGKYGLVEADRIIEPYDISLKALSKEQRTEWADAVAQDVGMRLSPELQLVLLAGSTYGNPLISRLRSLSRGVDSPLDGLSLGRRLARLKHAHRLLDRRDAIKVFYSNLSMLSRKTGLLSLSEIITMNIPKRGVYFFFDPHETTELSSEFPRLVRVGTHGVSAGSKATLRDRLRAHFGTKEGLGNHRSSIFRLHIGEAYIQREGLISLYPSWGKGQSADVAITRGERDIERVVSKYISRLKVLCVEIQDEPGKNSLRALLERNSIALFTENNVAIDRPSTGWLGQFSKQISVRESGLWNVRAVGDNANLHVTKFIGEDNFEERLLQLTEQQRMRKWF